MDNTLPIWTIYDNPSDYPGNFVVRRSLISHGGITPDPEPQIVTDTLEKARTVIPAGSIPFPRHETDDACIVESWL
jgi:hypothetical protein